MSNKNNYITAKESTEQIMIFRWAKLNERNYPELKLLYHIPNGGSRNYLEAVNLKRQGVKAGVPDICLPVARRNYHGLYIELKANNNKPTKSQSEWISDLTYQGFLACICWGFDEAVSVIKEYLKI